MKIPRATLITCLLFGLTASVWGAVAPSRPVPGKGAHSKTRILFTASHGPYSLLNSLELLKLQLGRFDSALDTIPLYQATPANVLECDYLVVLSLEPHETLPTNIISAIASAPIPVLWVGLGIDVLARMPSLRGQIELGATSEPQSGRVVNYRGKDWDVGAFSYREVRLPRKSGAQELLRLGQNTRQGRPAGALVCCRSKQFTLFAAEPQNGALGLVFEDILFDFFGVQEAAGPAVLLRINGYHAGHNHREFKRMADYLHARSIPFAVSISGLNDRTKLSDTGVEFISALRYGQQRGGRIVLQGSDAPSPSAEFWDDRTDRPRMQITGGGIRNRITSVAQAALGSDLLPIAWQTPRYAASAYSYQEIGSVFGTALERVQLSDATSRDNYASGGLTADQHGRSILPENLGFISESSNALAGVHARADLLKDLRGTILGASFDAFLSVAQLVQLVDLLESYQLPFIDLADFNNRVELPSAVLLTGDATAKVTLQNATIRWKTFNRAGQLLAEDEQRTKVNGQREFKRIGIGVFEVIEFNNEKR